MHNTWAKITEDKLINILVASSKEAIKNFSAKCSKNLINFPNTLILVNSNCEVLKQKGRILSNIKILN